MRPLTDATANQVKAANPTESTWLSANAGSGKTRVLIDRVARLLLNETDPQRILCLTYTKAAATEMQNRLFERLGEWAMMPDEKLRAALIALGEEVALDAAVLSRARQLFARAIDTPGGLRIQTIHSFCAMLLRRFPLEAGVSPQFTEMDDRAAQMLREDIFEAMSDDAHADLVVRLASVVTEGLLPDLIKQIVAVRQRFSSAVSRADLLAACDLPPDFDQTALLAEVFLGGEADLLASVVQASLAEKVGGREVRILEQVTFIDPGMPALIALERTMLFQKDAEPQTAKIGAFPHKEPRKVLSGILPQIEDLMRRVESARPRRLALLAVDRTVILQDFAAAFLAEYKSRKDARGWLDFDDLIQHARRLLTEPGLAAWVLYRLDGGIDHVLVDEAQDTSPDQWQIIQSLTDEFFVGEGRARKDRTLFVVGDKKQSIYSFQGADLEAFDRMNGHFAARLSAVNRSLEPGELLYSFRSSENILRLVDLVFQGASREAIGKDVQHHAIDSGQPGRIDVWPAIPSAEKAKDDEPYNPVDIPGENSAQSVLATRIASEITAILDAGTQVRIGAQDRPVHAGDILILVQRRSPLFAEIIRACKKAGLPIAGADRLKLGAEIAVKDLAALLAFLATPEDDLSLATALRSPLCGLSEAELFDLSQPRKGYLWQALRAASDRFGPVNAMLADLMAQADFLRPYEVIDRILTRHDGRRRLLARLGPEAEDGIDELLQQALSHERRDVPSLTSFLVALQTDEVEVKRQSDGAGRRIRVMTVHGAKGLEAPIVILPDTADYDPPDKSRLVEMQDGMMMHRPGKGALTERIAAALARRKERQAQERLRLLYVAMTRAQSWLIVAAAGEIKSDQSWHRLVSQAMQALGQTEVLKSGVLRHSHGNWPADIGPQPGEADLDIGLPDWAVLLAPEPQRPLPLVSPSLLGGAKAVPGEAGEDSDLSMQRGSALHLLLENLPLVDRDAWEELASALVGDPALRTEVLAQARAILDIPELAQLFGSDSLAEVPITADLAGRRLYGAIDRLVVTADRVLAVDFKSNRTVPARPADVPAGILAQMGAYAHALDQVYPGRQVDTAILWTTSANLMVLDRDIVRNALHDATIP
jgi:ATP-dependent helicase/nuclease subunit A